MNCALGEITRDLLLHKHVDRVWWAEELISVAHILSRILNSARLDVSPYIYERNQYSAELSSYLWHGGALPD